MAKKASTKPDSGLDEKSEHDEAVGPAENSCAEADELDIKRRVKAGLTRKQAEEAHARQKAHDAELAASQA